MDRGSAVAIIGASGTGKTTLANQYVVAAAKRGETPRCIFSRRPEESYRERAEGLGLAVDDFIDKGLVTLNHVDVAEFSAGEFSANASPGSGGERRPDHRHRHAERLRQRHVRRAVSDPSASPAFDLPVPQGGNDAPDRGAAWPLRHSALDMEVKNVSYLADAILLLRFFEHRGEIRRAMSVVKKRRGAHEMTIRELTLSGEGILIGEPLAEMQGVLTGVPILDV